jgi:hypothetical protein
MESESIEVEISKKGSSKKVKELSMKDIYGDEDDGEDYGDEDEDD